MYILRSKTLSWYIFALANIVLQQYLSCSWENRGEEEHEAKGGKSGNSYVIPKNLHKTTEKIPEELEYISKSLIKYYETSQQNCDWWTVRCRVGDDEFN